MFWDSKVSKVLMPSDLSLVLCNNAKRNVRSKQFSFKHIGKVQSLRRPVDLINDRTVLKFSVI